MIVKLDYSQNINKFVLGYLQAGLEAIKCDLDLYKKDQEDIFSIPYIIFEDLICEHDCVLFNRRYYEDLFIALRKFEQENEEVFWGLYDEQSKTNLLLVSVAQEIFEKLNLFEKYHINELHEEMLNDILYKLKTAMV